MAGMLIAAIAGRMLAASARRGGYDIAVLDLFNDLDTRALATVSQKIPGHEQGLARFSRHTLLQAARVLAPGDAYAGLVYGSGFEDDIALLGELAQGRKLYGNSPQVVARCKDPRQFFPLLDELNIAHSAVAFSLPQHLDGWLMKKIGGSGGAHVAPAAADAIFDQHYFQRFCSGKNYSVSFLADGERAMIIGVNEPWSIALGDWPYCYLGAINHVTLAETIMADIQRILNALVTTLNLRGLNGLDFIIEGDNLNVIEVNPRPSGTLDLYDADCPQGLFHWHLHASDGQLPTVLLTKKIIRAHAVVYTSHALSIDQNLAWPEWCSDIPEAPCSFAPRMPVCMVHAEGSDHESVKKMLDSRREKIRLNLQKQAA